MGVDVERERRDLLKEILQHVDPEYRAGMSRTLPTELRVYGVRVPRLREAARAWHRAHKGIAREEWIAMVEALWAGESREERLLAVHFSQRYGSWIPTLTWTHFDRWRRRLDNWEVTDGLAVWVLGPWIVAHPAARLGHLLELIGDEDVWSRRLALVATVPLNRGRAGSAIPDLTLDLVERVKEERQPMITKAVSWALRGMIEADSERVAGYVEENRETLAAHVLREVDSKLRTGLKSGKGDG